MLDERKASILHAVVSEYIQTAQPVGSAHVAGTPGLEVSAATIRSEMAQLEQEGYLHQPHTSAGRVPTEKGYRVFVDELTGPTPTLGPRHARQVKEFFDTTHGEIEHMLAQTTRLLAGLTRYAAVVLAPSSEGSPVKSVQLVGLAPRIVMLVAVLANATVEKRTVELDRDVTDAEVDTAGSHIGSALVGHPYSALERLPDAGDPTVDTIVQAFSIAARTSGGVDADQVYVGGTAQMAGAFDAVETVKRVLTILEQQLVVVSLVRDVLDRGLQVAIGSETGLTPLADCSVVVARYEVDGEPAGSIGLLGPTRMDYPKALATVAVVSQRLGEHLTEG